MAKNNEKEKNDEISIIINSSKEIVLDDEPESKIELFEKPEPKSKPKSKSNKKKPIIFQAINFNIKNSTKRTFLEDWMMNSLAPNGEDELLLMKNKRENQMILNENEGNNLDINDNNNFQEEEDIKDMNIQEENEENDNNKNEGNMKQTPNIITNINNDQYNEKSLYEFSLDRFNENKYLRDLLKKRKLERKEELSGKIKEIFMKNKAELTLFTDPTILNLLQKNLKKFPKISNK